MQALFEVHTNITFVLLLGVALVFALNRQHEFDMVMPQDSDTNPPPPFLHH